MRSFYAIASLALFIAANSALAAPWAGFAAEGSNDRFGWSSVDDADPTQAGHTSPEGALMGTPSINENGFFFLDSNIVVDNANPSVNAVNEWGVSTTGSNVGNISIPALPMGASSDPITELIVRESGTYTGTDPTNDFQVLVTMVVTPIDPPPTLPFLPPFETVSAFTSDVNFNQDGTWDVEFTIDTALLTQLPNAGMNTFRLDLTNQLQLTALGQQKGSSITKDRADILVPEPAAGLMVLVGAAAFLRRKRA